MIIDLIDKLISRIIELLKEEQRVKKSMHDDFVIPLMGQFEEIHKNYIQTFIKYRGLINDGNSLIVKTDPIFKEIKKDSLSSDIMRIKLAALWRALDGRRDNSDNLMRLLEYIGRYLEFAVRSPIPRNYARANLSSDLIGATKEQANSIIDEKLNQLQSDFAYVQEQYQKLKMQMVK